MDKNVVGGITPIIGKIVLNYIQCCNCGNLNKDIEINLILSNNSIQLEQKKIKCSRCNTINLISNNELIDLMNFSIEKLEF